MSRSKSYVARIIGLCPQYKLARTFCGDGARLLSHQASELGDGVYERRSHTGLMVYGLVTNGVYEQIDEAKAIDLASQMKV